MRIKIGGRIKFPRNFSIAKSLDSSFIQPGEYSSISPELFFNLQKYIHTPPVPSFVTLQNCPCLCVHGMQFAHWGEHNLHNHANFILCFENPEYSVLDTQCGLGLNRVVNKPAHNTMYKHVYIFTYTYIFYHICIIFVYI